MSAAHSYVIDPLLIYVSRPSDYDGQGQSYMYMYSKWISMMESWPGVHWSTNRLLDVGLTHIFSETR
jgi:hypothetical protein